MIYNIRTHSRTGEEIVVSAFSGQRVPPLEEAWVLFNARDEDDARRPAAKVLTQETVQ